MKKNIIHNYDIEKSWLVRGANFDHDIPIIETATDMPTALLPFSKCNRATNFSNWVHFYEPDDKFVRLKNNPLKYVGQLRRFGGIISPDFSICPDYPLPLQYSNKYWNHALAYWLSTQGIPVIPNVRWGDERSFDFCFNGIEKSSIVAVGTHGQMKDIVNKNLFINGLSIMVAKLSPHTIIVYGTAPDDVFRKYKDAGIRIIQFPSETEQYYNHRKDVA